MITKKEIFEYFKTAWLIILALYIGYLRTVCNHTPDQVMKQYQNKEYQLLDRIGVDKCKSYFMLTDSVIPMDTLKLTKQ